MKEIVEHLSAFILANHKWFSHGFANAAFNKEIGMVFREVANGEFESLAFEDNIGSYFYIRHNNKLSYSTNAQPISGCLASIRKTMPCTLVALLLEGDTFKLEQCLLNSILTWKNKSFSATPTSCIIDTFTVIEEEIKDAEAAKQASENIGNHSLVSISFNIAGDFHSVATACPCVPCKSGQCP